MNRLMQHNEFLKSHWMGLISSIENPQHQQGDDDRMRWAAILQMAKTIPDLQTDTVVDLGSSASHLAALLKRHFSFQNGYAYDALQHFAHNTKFKVKSVKANFLDVNIDYQIDLAVDANTVRSFNARHDKTCPNFGFASTFKKVYQALNPGGRFLLCTDVAAKNSTGEFISPTQIQSMASNAGFYFTEYEDIESPHVLNYGTELNIYMLELRK